MYSGTKYRSVQWNKVDMYSGTKYRSVQWNIFILSTSKGLN